MKSEDLRKLIRKELLAESKEKVLSEGVMDSIKNFAVKVSKSIVDKYGGEDVASEVEQDIVQQLPTEPTSAQIKQASIQSFQKYKNAAAKMMGGDNVEQGIESHFKNKNFDLVQQTRANRLIKHGLKDFIGMDLDTYAPGGKISNITTTAPGVYTIFIERTRIKKLDNTSDQEERNFRHEMSKAVSAQYYNPSDEDVEKYKKDNPDFTKEFFNLGQPYVYDTAKLEYSEEKDRFVDDHHVLSTLTSRKDATRLSKIANTINPNSTIKPQDFNIDEYTYLEPEQVKDFTSNANVVKESVKKMSKIIKEGTKGVSRKTILENEKKALIKELGMMPENDNDAFLDAIQNDPEGFKGTKPSGPDSESVEGKLKHMGEVLAGKLDSYFSQLFGDEEDTSKMKSDFAEGIKDAAWTAYRKNSRPDIYGH